ncbi:glycosyltransferase family 4 protein [Streptomyces aidingensis]|uniref:Glycosyltransferase Family 4 n=1 Tax=Streptomyces aidingensis TaxID=910347 RepID=A0A1I1UI59_9ACTN|nr:glycosyltransferase family 4 protein [Streptomyces aidingensis]SFD70459.1 Glycosyltransferase Family 4 [Streptomyces aidingensis]
MNRRRPEDLKVCVLQVPPFDPARMLGGAEVVAVHLVRALASSADVTVLHGFPADARPAGSAAEPGFPARVIAAFPLDEHVREHGHISPRLTGPALRSLQEADVIVTVERTLDLPADAPRIACLGGVGYPHTLDVLRHRAWDRLVVPSPFVARQVREHAPQAANVSVVANGIDLTHFTPRPAGQARDPVEVRLLVAGRPGWDKGFRQALGLARAMEAGGTPTTLMCFAQPDGFGAAGFTAQLRREAEAHAVRLRIMPWQPHHRMPAVYHRADLTLCLGDAAEGFGLVAAESVACGTPVAATPSGFLADMLPPGHGLYLVPPGADPAELVPTAREAMRHGPDQCRHRGRPYIGSHYGLPRMTTAFRHLVEELAA